MTAIPFGIVGAFLGHFLLGHEVTLWSMVGVVAVSGVVVNDNLVLIDAINSCRREGMSLREAVLEAGQTRFRPIMLTSLTTFAGRAPLIIDNAMAARFLVPMAVSLAFGVLFATLVSLILVPTLMLVGSDIRGRAVEFFRRDIWRRHVVVPAASEADSVEVAYRAGALVSRHGEARLNPYDGPELWAAWEAGYAAHEPPAGAVADQ